LLLNPVGEAAATEQPCLSAPFTLSAGRRRRRCCAARCPTMVLTAMGSLAFTASLQPVESQDSMSVVNGQMGDGGATAHPRFHGIADDQMGRGGEGIEMYGNTGFAA
uniref:Uncharacterized protein n=1 Tax=Triticum urartu TaxID=4572 RepID=A0A8R7QM88_TRIUA